MINWMNKVRCSRSRQPDKTIVGYTILLVCQTSGAVSLISYILISKTFTTNIYSLFIVEFTPNGEPYIFYNISWMKQAL